MKKFISLLIGIVLISTVFVFPAFAYTDSQIEQSANLALEFFKNNKQETGVDVVYGLDHTTVVAMLGKQNDPEYDFMKMNVDVSTINDKTSAGTIAKMILSRLVLGLDVKNVNGVDLSKKLLDLQQADGSFFSGTGSPTTDQTTWAMIALDTLNIDYNRAQAIQSLKKAQRADKGFNDSATPTFDVSTIDSTAYVIIALARYTDDVSKELVKTSLEYLESTLDNDGFFIGGFGKSSNSQATGVMALTATNQDLTSARWFKNNKSVVDALLSFQDATSGVFNYDVENPSWGGNNMSTNQSVVALLEVKNKSNVFFALNKDFSYPKKAIVQATPQAVTTTTSEKNPKTGDSTPIAFSIIIAMTSLLVVTKTKSKV
jgi:hypothetical protein